jgi:hypothetical protein
MDERQYKATMCSSPSRALRERVPRMVEGGVERPLGGLTTQAIFQNRPGNNEAQTTVGCLCTHGDRAGSDRLANGVAVITRSLLA